MNASSTGRAAKGAAIAHTDAVGKIVAHFDAVEDILKGVTIGRSFVELHSLYDPTIA
ncbi:hypothetical protein P9281_02805 [Caballeronia sp. LP003]|uniref:hypothetical protein n=1 Tax=Caballeronia sp. LP003 TaxID=3038551 RepID=UPI002857F3B2|nr:hypothetical protein [Caballeronia sp. LP003]MDR5785480.1 hypothetical protein [Caballeronia sp. LP003]